MSRPHRFTQVDAFTAKVFAGNPAAVYLLPEAGAETWMQAVAREMSLAATAFLVPCPDGYRLRWFTTTSELDLCGHATLASAHVLWEDGHLDRDAPARFHTRSGLLTARRENHLTWLDFPATPAEAVAAPKELQSALGARTCWAGQTRLDYLVELESEAAVRGLAPDLARLARLPVRGVIVTAPAENGGDFVSRFFAPAVGIPEDSVTGSSHCALGPYWGEQLGRTELVGFQVSARGGEVRVRLEGDRVQLGGQAVTVLKGELFC